MEYEQHVTISINTHLFSDQEMSDIAIKHLSHTSIDRIIESHRNQICNSMRADFTNLVSKHLEQESIGDK